MQKIVFFLPDVIYERRPLFNLLTREPYLRKLARSFLRIGNGTDETLSLYYIQLTARSYLDEVDIVKCLQVGN